MARRDDPTPPNDEHATGPTPPAEPQPPEHDRVPAAPPREDHREHPHEDTPTAPAERGAEDPRDGDPGAGDPRDDAPGHAGDRGARGPCDDAPAAPAEREAGGSQDGTPAAARERGAEDPHGNTVTAPAPLAGRGAGKRRRRRWGPMAGMVVLLAVVMTGSALAVGAARDGRGAAGHAAGAPEPFVGNSRGADVTSLQAHLRAQPKDHGGWAALGLAYVEEARTKGDPARYPQAEKALARSLELAPGNEQALAGRAALAAARHDFAGALSYADRALKQNPYSERALCSRIDALVELGRYDEASEAADTADARRPGVPVFARYAYVRELRGDVTTARRVLEQALASATARGDIAYVATQLGRLAWNQGEYKEALGHYARALAADDGYLPALEGRARARAASGDRADAVRDLEDVVSRYPLPGPLVDLGELYEARAAAGDRAKAENQYALVDAWIALARAGGVNADLDTALAAADHGDTGAALRAARAEWARRHTVHTADALAWALYRNGRAQEALPHARQATATGYRSAAFLYHRGMIERATGHDDAARTHLTAALRLNPGFSPPAARAARTALKSLEAAR
ncbi:tetratricopeptide repeat protein [Streptomyces sp. NPDC087787]|uniref:tetratricopeptide repeat protein n=1 Tax=Streptomyces sp. NPDC087787 TaxID=3365803 RepID=UPI00381F36A4